MRHAKHDSKQKRRTKALPVLGAAGLSLALASGASAVPSGPAVDMPTPNTGEGHEFTFGEEEISDVTLATFYVFDKENVGTPGVQLVGGGCKGCKGCGGGGCKGCGGGCKGCGGGCRGCGHGCGHGCGWGGCVGIWWGGCGGCGGGGYWCWRNGVRVWCYY
jgi:hypothetical protein